MAISESDRLLVRTSDGLQYELDDSGGVRQQVGLRGRERLGEYVETDERLGDYIAEVASAITHGPVRSIGADKVQLTFGISMSATGAFFLAKGSSDAHIVVTLEFQAAQAKEALCRRG
jgi:hypothetical protein